MLPKVKGLPSAEARARLEQFGKNVLPEKPPPSDLVIFFSQLKNPLVYILLVAALSTLALRDFADTTIIFLALLINTVLGFFQERKAGKSLAALKKLVEFHAQVVRDGRIMTVLAEELVPGDIVLLGQGNKVTADGKLIEANRFSVSEAILTGESLPVSKEKGDRVFMGTVVNAGRAYMQVEITGAQSEIGKIALKVQEPELDTPLKRQIKKLSKQLSLMVLALTILVLLAGLLTGSSIVEIVTTSIALAVSAIPEGLLVGLTVVLAIGMQRILSKRGLVRRLVSAETLGGVTTICIDKTGTLTEGNLEVADVVGEEEQIAQQMILANDLDDPLVITAFKWAKSKVKDSSSKHQRLDSLPFSPKKRYFASLNKWDKNTNILFVNGAPEYILEWTKADKAKKKEILATVASLSKEGKRIIGLAKKQVSTKTTKISADGVTKDLEWVGLIAFWDPIRTGVEEALKKTESAGISLVVITGDYPQTAISVMNQLAMSIAEDEILLGSSVEKISSVELGKKIEKIKLFARTSPDQKEKIVEALKNNGEVVAMMGDGVNDAPALNKADIGIVVGDATDVARESADLVLLDSNFATIVAAIEEGRGIFDNIRKVILYLLSDSFEEIIAVLSAMLLGLPLPVTAAQILWINLISDGFPDLALTVDPINKGVMARPPRNPKEPIVANWMKGLILIVSVAGGLTAFGLFVFTFKTTTNIELSRSVAFAALGINSLVYVYSIKSLREPFWKGQIFNNKWLFLAVVAGLVLQISPFVSTGLGRFLGVERISLTNWTLVFATSLLMFIMIEISKVIFRRKLL
jgi:Ca2+-transporting ATPase